MKEHTIIFVPHARAKFRKWRFTTLQAAVLLGTLLVLTVGGVVTTFLYVNTSFDRQQLDLISEENTELRREKQQFERSIRQIEGQLGEYRQQIQKLAIVAGVAELSPTSEAGIGGPSSLDGDSDLLGDLRTLELQVGDMGLDMGELRERFDERRLLVSSMPAVTPVKGLLTSHFGYRTDPFTKRRAFHAGIDIVAPRGKEIRATGDGIVTRTGSIHGLGRAVYLSHGFGITTRYGHMLKILVKEGQRVKRGDVLGLVGNSGRATGYHLHYEVHVDGQATNPLGYILDDTRP